MVGSQFYKRANNPTHPCHQLTQATPPPRHMKTTPSQHYTAQLRDIPPPPPGTSEQKHLHTVFTQRALNSYPPNSVLNGPPPDISTSELSLPRTLRVHLSRLRSGHHPLLQSYRHRLGLTPTDSCPRCHLDEPEDVQHLFLRCPSLSDTRASLGLGVLGDLWTRPGDAALLLEAAGFPV